MRMLFFTLIFHFLFLVAQSKKEERSLKQLSSELQSLVNKKEVDDHDVARVAKEILKKLPVEESFSGAGIFSGDSFRIGITKMTHFVSSFELSIQLNQLRRDLDDSLHLRMRFGDFPVDVIPFLVVDGAPQNLEEMVPSAGYFDGYLWSVPGYQKVLRMSVEDGKTKKSGNGQVFLRSTQNKCNKWSDFVVSWRARPKVFGSVIFADPSFFCSKALREGRVVIVGAEYTPTHFGGRDVEIVSERWRIVFSENAKPEAAGEIPSEWRNFSQNEDFWVSPGV